VYPFTYSRATGLTDALQRQSDDSGAKLLAGGMTLLPSMKFRLAAPSQLIDISRLPELRGISREGAQLMIGAAMRHREVADDATVRAAIPALSALAGMIGDAQVRNRGTLGGSVANSDPAADYPSAVLALKGQIVTDRRTIAADDFFLGMFTTALEEGEMIKSIRFACPTRAAYAKFRHPASGYAMTGVFVAQYEAGGASEVRVAVTGAAPSVFRWEAAEVALSAKCTAASLDGISLSADGLNADLHAPAEYRANLARVLTLRAVEQMNGGTR
jgi:carbon-monoxide dehydrogenase medium subunit